MVRKPYQWPAKLEPHTKRKHKVLREYIFQYIMVRCKNPRTEKLRIAIVDGFSGAGRYECGSAGSPIIFIEEMRRAIDAINLNRTSQSLGLLDVECLLILNDADHCAVNLLKEYCAPVIAEIKENCPRFKLDVCYMHNKFERSYPEIKRMISAKKYKSALYNLDQCGTSKVSLQTMADIMGSTQRTEIFYTFAIKSLLAFLSKTNPQLLASQLQPFGIATDRFNHLSGVMSSNDWLGAAENMVFKTFKVYAKYVTPFSIHNPKGWRYWLIHFANNYRARQVYNDVLHDNSSNQAHFGRSGLHMLDYNPEHESGLLYLFDVDGRKAAINQLSEDIPRFIVDYGGAMSLGKFYEEIYNSTPAHKDDVHSAIMENDDIEVCTPSGGMRKVAHTISINDTIIVKPQRSLFHSLPKQRKSC